MEFNCLTAQMLLKTQFETGNGELLGLKCCLVLVLSPMLLRFPRQLREKAKGQLRGKCTQLSSSHFVLLPSLKQQLKVPWEAELISL